MNSITTVVHLRVKIPCLKGFLLIQIVQYKSVSMQLYEALSLKISLVWVWVWSISVAMMVHEMYEAKGFSVVSLIGITE